MSTIIIYFFSMTKLSYLRENYILNSKAGYHGDKNPFIKLLNYIDSNYG